MIISGVFIPPLFGHRKPVGEQFIERAAAIRNGGSCQAVWSCYDRKILPS